MPEIGNNSTVHWDSRSLQTLILRYKLKKRIGGLIDFLASVKQFLGMTITKQLKGGELLDCHQDATKCPGSTS